MALHRYGDFRVEVFYFDSPCSVISVVHISLQNQYIAMLLSSYRYWYWVLVSLEANIIGYWILGVLFCIVLTLIHMPRLFVKAPPLSSNRRHLSCDDCL